MAMVKRLCDCCSLGARCGTARHGQQTPSRRSRAPQGASRPVPHTGPGAAPEPALPAALLSSGVPRPGRAPSPSWRSAARPRSGSRERPRSPGPPGAPSPPAAIPHRDAGCGAALPGGQHGARRVCHRGACPATRSSRGRDSRLAAHSTGSGRPAAGNPRSAPGSPGHGPAQSCPVSLWQRGRSPGRRLGQDTVSRRAGPAERAGPAGTCS